MLKGEPFTAVQECKWKPSPPQGDLVLGIFFAGTAVADHDSEFPAIAEVGVELGVSKETEVSSTAKKVTDFVWAIRLAKVTKGLVDRQWSNETFSKGATFGLGNEKEMGKQIADALRGEGIGAVEGADSIDASDEAFIIGAQSDEA